MGSRRCWKMIGDIGGVQELQRDDLEAMGELEYNARKNKDSKKKKAEARGSSFRALAWRKQQQFECCQDGAKSLVFFLGCREEELHELLRWWDVDMHKQ